MTTLTLPKHLDEWAQSEVAAGRAKSVEDLAREALEAHRARVEAFRSSLQAAVDEAERDGWLEGEDVLGEMDDMIAALEREADAN